MNSFAIYRLPHAQYCTLIEGEAQTLQSISDLNGLEGFVIAPFNATAEVPLVVIKGEPTPMPHPLSLPKRREEDRLLNGKTNCSLPYREGQGVGLYPFSSFHTAILEGRFQKLVLARRALEKNDGSRTPISLFEEACRRYPRMFIALVHTPQTGTWLTATPELLLEIMPEADRWHTIALAGTMQLRDDELNGEGEHLRWSPKNIQEQRYVASYIADVLHRFSNDVREEGPCTVRAANLVHLRSDFTFTLNDGTRVAELLEALHPTPAVCGLPKEEALRFILEHEQTPRRYYSGFMGPLTSHLSSLNSTLSSLNSKPSTHLYVSLRCMEITASHYCLYAGGGLLKDSVADKEWQETEAKMDTMRQLLKKEP